MNRRKIRTALASTRYQGDAPFYPTVADCHFWTYIINHILFGGAVPKYRKAEVRRLRGIFAWCTPHTGARGKRYCTLTVRDKFENFRAFYSILVHELIHAHEWTSGRNMTHGPFFLSHKELAAKLGVRLQVKY